MTNQEMIAAVERWQADHSVNPLTCRGNGHTHPPLTAREKDGQVILTCRGCTYRQTLTPTLIAFLMGVSARPKES